MSASWSSNPPARASIADPSLVSSSEKVELQPEAPSDLRCDQVCERATLNVLPLPARPRGQQAVIEFAGDRAVLVAALARGEEGAAAAFFHEYSSLVERTLARILGADSELPDAMQEVFLRALRSAHLIRDPQALTEWVRRLAVFTAMDWLRSRYRRRMLTLVELARAERPPATVLDEPGREALQATYRVLDRLGVEDRTIFALRFLEGLELTQLADACDCSLATVKRRLQRARKRFEAIARREPALAPWLAASDDGEGAAS